VSRTLKLALWLVLALAPATLTGCPAVAWFVAQFEGSQKVKPLYQPPRGHTVAVLVDDLFVPAPDTVKARLAEKLNRQLLDNGLAKSTVAHDKVQAALEGPTIVSVGEAGKKVGADLVLYVNIERFGMRDDETNVMWHPVMQCSVRWVDVSTSGGPRALGKRLWPTDRADGHVVGPVDLPAKEDTSPAAENDLSNELVDRMAAQIADLFYEHEPRK
jgi:hypothetical protein